MTYPQKYIFICSSFRLKKTVTLPPREAVWGAAQVCGPSCGPSRCSLFSGPPFHDTLEGLLSSRPAVNHSGPAYAGVLFLQTQAMQLWLLLKALCEKM